MMALLFVAVGMRGSSVFSETGRASTFTLNCCPSRETVLTRIGVDSASRHEVIEFCQILGASIVDVTRDALTIEVTGGEHKIDRFLSLIEDYDVQMLTRSGRIALPKPRQ